MTDTYTNLSKVIEKLINLRINDIIDKGKFNNESINEFKTINETIAKNIKIKKIKNKNDIPVDDKILTIYTTFIKDANRLVKDKSTLNFLPHNIVTQIKSHNDKNAKDKFKEFARIWKILDEETKNKYKNLCQNKNFTNGKYNELVIKTPKQIRKKKSKENI
jgi:hypothetical protein